MKVSKSINENSDVVELQGDDRPSIECLMLPLEPLVYDTMCEILPDHSKAAEIGSFKGGSSCIFTKGMERRGKTLDLSCHDLFEPFDVKGEIHDIGSIFDKNTSAWGVHPTKVKGDSKITHSVHEEETLDYVFVDGDHSYEGACSDIRNFVPKLKRDGWIIIQDSHGDVMRAVEDSLPPDFFSWVVRPPVAHFVTIANRDIEKLESFIPILAEKISKKIEHTGDEISYDIQ